MIMMLDVCRKDFEALITRFEMQQEFERKGRLKKCTCTCIICFMYSCTCTCTLISYMYKHVRVCVCAYSAYSGTFLL